MNFHVKRSKKRFLGFLAIAIRKKTFYFFSFWLAAFFYPFYIKNEKNRKSIFISAWFLGAVPLKHFKIFFYFFKILKMDFQYDKTIKLFKKIKIYNKLLCLKYTLI